MNINKPINTIFAVLAIVFAFIMTPGAANAQGRYANTYSKTQVRGYIDRLVSSSNTFKRDFDNYMDRSNLNGTPTEDQFNQNVRNYQSAVNDLQRQYNRHSNWWDSRSNVERMLTEAQPVNDMINQLPFARNIERQWRAMRDDINKVADTYDLAGLNGGGWNGGGGNGGGWNGGGGNGGGWNGGGGNGGGWNGGGGGRTSTPPSWAQGTFTWLGSDPRKMTIERNGRVSIDALGNVTYGTFYNNVISINGEQLQITRSGTGVRLYNPRDNGTSDWQKGNGGWNGGGGNNGGGGWNGDGGGGPTSTPPNWAQGSFSWNGTDPRQMIIDRQGRVTLTSHGNTTYGSFYNNVITINGEQLTVSRNGNGIRLYNANGGGTSDWRR